MKRLIIVLVTLGLSAISCEQSNFADINQDPSTINEPDLVYLFTGALQDMEQGHYTQWFYDNSQYFLPWSQVTAGQGGSETPQGNNSQMNLFQASGNRVDKWYSLMSPLFEIRKFINEEYSGQEQASYQKLRAITYPIQIYYGLRVTDVYGSRPYTEAMRARYTNPPMLTPKWDTQQELYDKWIEELNSALEVLASDPSFEGQTVNQVSLNEQDFVYGGNWIQWAKFMNSLKLRIAVRMLQQNRDKAISTAEAVVNDQFGPISNMEDNFNWNAGTEYYGPADNEVLFAPAAKGLIDFMRENQDPRVRFMFDKNDFNSMVIQGFYDAGKEDDIPSYIRQYIRSSVIDGRRVFEGWEAPGEPWVRYFGGPVAPDSTRSGSVANEYFRTQNWRLESKTYEPKSLYKQEMFGTNRNITYPDIPAQTAQNEEDKSYHNVLYSAAETNLYLAEFKLLGANIPNSADSYFREGVRQSIETYDWMAENNGVLYYNEPYDTEFGASVSLKSGEIQELLGKQAYSLSGGNQAEMLEKIYIQQYLHFLGHPTQLFVTSLRSGVPKSDSQYLARVPFWDGGVEMTIPRRFVVGEPGKDDINFENVTSALQEQGLTPGGDDPQTLHDERLWYDKGAPDWGQGPNY